jgi:hypothetical protein
MSRISSLGSHRLCSPCAFRVCFRRLLGVFASPARRPPRPCGTLYKGVTWDCHSFSQRPKPDRLYHFSHRIDVENFNTASSPGFFLAYLGDRQVFWLVLSRLSMAPPSCWLRPDDLLAALRSAPHGTDPFQSNSNGASVSVVYTDSYTRRCMGERGPTTRSARRRFVTYYRPAAHPICAIPKTVAGGALPRTDSLSSGGVRT